MAESLAEPEQVSRRSSYVWGLDLIRFAAAVMVVFFHLSWKSENPDIAFAAGWVGVEIFFVISGFVIMGSAVGTNVATFTSKRFARLYPAAIACAVINLAVLIPWSDLAARYGLAVSATPRAFIASLVLIKGPFLVGALWTLPVEIGFYAIIGLLIWRGWIGRPMWIASALILWSGFYLIPFCLSQYELLPVAVRPLGYGLLNLTMLRHGCFFGVGILLWVTTQSGAGRRGATARYAMLALGIALCCVEIVARVVELRADYAHAVDTNGLITSAMTTFLVAIVGMWLFSRLNDVVQPGANTISFIRKRLGLVTYPLYLMHEGVGGVTSSLLQAAGYRQGMAAMAGLALSLAASWLVVVFLEPWLRPKLMAIVEAIVARIPFTPRTGTSA